jgi:hypothetical protein
MKVSEENSQLTQLNEMFVNVLPSLPEDIENSIYYPKLKVALHPEIHNFCREKVELQQDLNILRMSIGEQLTEKEIREYLDTLKAKYNTLNNDIAIDYHLEATRIDYGVAVFVVIKRSDISMKKFVFRFRKDINEGLEGLTNSGVPIKDKRPEPKESNHNLLDPAKLFSGGR